MKISFLGAARTVTGSCYVVECERARFAIDCGMHQGNRVIELRNWDENGVYRPESLDFILLTHAHIDHSGLLPRLVGKGFSGPIPMYLCLQQLLLVLLLYQ
jgi:metallo-beta-lactamase family protein